MPNPYLEAKKISSQKTGKTLVESVDFVAHANSLNMVMGANGAGKTSLLRCLAGLDAINTGTILLEGKPLYTYSQKQRATKMAWVGERFDIAFSYTVMDLMLMGRFPCHLGYPGAKDKDICFQLLKKFDLQDHANATVDILSSGACRKLMIARALAQDTKVIILDEPCANLDTSASKQLMIYLQDIARIEQKTIILSTHDVQVVQYFADYVSIIDDARMVASGPCHDIIGLEIAKKFFWNVS